MNRVLIGNDIFLQICVSCIGGEPENFTHVQSMDVNLWHMFHLPNRKPMAYAVTDNVVLIRYNADEQGETGWYGVTITYTKPDETSETGLRNYTVDVPYAFELIRSTDYDCCPVCMATQREPLELCAHTMLCRDGRDGIDGSVLWPSVHIASDGVLVLNLPDETENNTLVLDDEGYLCLLLNDL